ncbi:MAG TPA: DUF5063 domain-containing protein [Bacteroidales bacterium]|nr:DUF5063 domain-containing protein [Bacteroidales bacterium]HSA42653.1 DUF5063 domain-containing protein [Bacteroidales bacterium]
MDFIDDDPKKIKQVLEMLTLANDYCLFLEKAGQYTPSEVRDYLHKICPLLYLKGSLLPDISDKEDELIPTHYTTEEQWESIYNTMKPLFGSMDKYQYHFFRDAFGLEQENCSLAENFADIYQDMKDFVLAYQARTYTAQQSAVFHCARLFKIHWGPRILESLPVIHNALYPAEHDAVRDD